MPSSPNYRIESLSDIQRLRECIAIQQKVWGFTDRELLPLRSLVVSGKIGGQVFGAIDGEDNLLGFLTAMPGYRGGKVYLHSHMMGVLPEYRNLGIGRSLKLAQRQDALNRGIPRVEWTFDPLELRNANFNIESLGVICRRYDIDTYGVTSSPLHGNLPTDRLLAEWHLTSSRVGARISKSSVSNSNSSAAVCLELPLNIQELKTADPVLASSIQMNLRHRFLELFGSGYWATGFKMDKPRNTASYVLEPFDEACILS
jgi:predicted GNAT superfamily acetyltransferase